MRELFIEELAEVRGGNVDPLDKVIEFLRDRFGPSTDACGEEGPDLCSLGDLIRP